MSLGTQLCRANHSVQNEKTRRHDAFAFLRDIVSHQPSVSQFSSPSSTLILCTTTLLSQWFQSLPRMARLFSRGVASASNRPKFLAAIVPSLQVIPRPASYRREPSNTPQANLRLLQNWQLIIWLKWVFDWPALKRMNERRKIKAPP